MGACVGVAVSEEETRLISGLSDADKTSAGPVALGNVCAEVLGVGVGVAVGAEVGALVGVFVGVGVFIGVGVFVGERVGVEVAVGAGVDVLLVDPFVGEVITHPPVPSVLLAITSVELGIPTTALASLP